ncbi:MAG: sulfite exporter TauE/SafE family protein [Verrucomicrobiota bacterium]
MIDLSVWQWVLMIFAAAMIGLAKTGLAGVGMLSVAIFANILPTKLSSGFVLPMLIFADVVAVASYRRHTEWKHVWRLLPWTAAGVIIGYFAMNRIDNREAALLIGSIVLAMTAMQIWRKYRPAAADAQTPGWLAPVIGVLAGFTTLVANAAGPLMAIYLLAMRMPKLAFVGTAAVFFMVLNVFKVPFMIDLGLITTGSFGTNLILAPAVLAGALFGRWLLPRINQRVFELLVLAFSLLAGLKLLWG